MKIKLKLAPKFALAMSAAMIVIMACLIIYQVLVQQEATQRELAARGSELARVLAVAAVQPVLNYDDMTLKSLMDQVVANDEVALARAASADGSLSAEASSESRGELHEFNYEIPGLDGVVLGTILVSIDSAPFYDRMYSAVWLIVQSLSITGLAVLLVVHLIFTGAIARPLKKLTESMRGIAEGKADFKHKLGIDSQDEIGDLARYFDRSTARFSDILADTERQSQAALRAKSALDHVSNSVIMADADANILYVNQSAQKLFGKLEQAVSRKLGNFTAESLQSLRLDTLLDAIMGRSDMLQTLSEARSEELELDTYTLRLIFNPVIDEHGKLLGCALELSNRTAEVAVEREVAEIVTAARSGDLERRIEIDGKEGFFRHLGEDINEFLALTESALRETSEVLGGLAHGELNRTVQSDYHGIFGQLKEDVNNTVDNLRDTISRLQSALDEIDSAAHEVVTGNRDLSQRTEIQASNLDESAGRMDELTTTVKLNAEHAGEANELSRDAGRLADQGGAVVGSAVEAMAEIHSSSSRIADIIGVIDEIAFQTNLLALNASVEAARAGEQGRGFAVVATEVRNLAGRSATAAKEIKLLIQDSVAKVEAGTQLVNQSGQTLQDIVAAVKKVEDIIDKIAAAGAAQSDSIQQVDIALRKMEEMTQQNAALAEETSAASTSQSDQVKSMVQLMAHFKR